MKIYRAMSQKEANDSLNAKKPVFIKRFKWFSPSLEFITRRVQNGNFANSKFKESKYSIILEFDITDQSLSLFRSVGCNEIMLDRRVANSVHVNSVSVI